VTVFPFDDNQGGTGENNRTPIIRVSLSTYNNGGQVHADLNSKGKTVCNKAHPVTVRFTNSGRQNDFHYWFDTDNLDVGPSCAVLLGNLVDQGNFYYNLQLMFEISYRIPCLMQSQGKREMVELVYKPREVKKLEMSELMQETKTEVTEDEKEEDRD
jgi:hypothetical protein